LGIVSALNGQCRGDERDRKGTCGYEELIFFHDRMRTVITFLPGEVNPEARWGPATVLPPDGGGDD
jgi:hypothetical protein